MSYFKFSDPLRKWPGNAVGGLYGNPRYIWGARIAPQSNEKFQVQVNYGPAYPGWFPVETVFSRRTDAVQFIRELAEAW